MNQLPTLLGLKVFILKLKSAFGMELGNLLIEFNSWFTFLSAKVGIDGSYYNNYNAGWTRTSCPQFTRDGSKLATVISTDQGDLGYFPHIVIFRSVSIRVDTKTAPHL